jgi:hypothetical protein
MVCLSPSFLPRMTFRGSKSCLCYDYRLFFPSTLTAQTEWQAKASSSRPSGSFEVTEHSPTPPQQSDKPQALKETEKPLDLQLRIRQITGSNFRPEKGELDQDFLWFP